MKTFKSFAYLMAIAIVGVAVSSCKQKEVEQTSYNPERETVKTQFSINLPTNVTGTQKKMRGTQVNASESVTDFHGIECMQIIPFGSTTFAGATANANIIPLSAQISSGNTDINNKTQSKIYNDVFMPIGTQGLLFYGRAVGSTAITGFGNEADDANKHTYGALTANAALTTNPFVVNNVDFAPVKIGSRPTDGDGATLIAYLNSVKDAQAAADNKWAETDEVQLMELYNQFTAGSAAEPGLRNGSGANVTAMMNELYLEVSKTVVVNQRHIDLKAAILTAINNATYVLTNAVYTSGDALTTKLVLKENLAGYPHNLAARMPDGAAALAWNTTNKAFEMTETDFGGTTVARWNNYVYPASLYYFAKGGIKASDNSNVAKTYNEGSNQSQYAAANWTTMLGLYADSQVKNSTRSIAMVNPVNYAVGRLDLAVRAKSTAVETRDAGVTLDFSNITLTGVLISGVNDVIYDFTPKTGDQTYVYYDDVIDNGTVNITNAATWKTLDGSANNKWNNYTLVLESKDATALNICLEFLNNDKDFHGYNGQLIAKGTKFYLVGQLNPAMTDDANNTHVAHTLTQVFVQDHKTQARITIGDVTGDKAYNVIPDLKVPQLEFALSVDLAWQQGMEFDLTW